MDYKTSGVDIEKGREFVEELKNKIPTIGGFNGMVEIPSGYENPVLVSGTDGVGTKINLCRIGFDYSLSLIHISEPTRRRGISYAVF